MKTDTTADRLTGLRVKVQLAEERLARLRQSTSPWQQVEIVELERHIGQLRGQMTALDGRAGQTAAADTGSGPYITWIHLSDLHFRLAPQTLEDRKPYDSGIVLAALLEDIAGQIAQYHLRPDFVVVTGDVAFSGRKEEYDLADEFFDRLLETAGLGKERLFVVPGNHDVDRSLVTDAVRARGDAIQDRSQTNAVLATAGDRSELMARFEGYAAWTARYFGSERGFDSRRYYYVSTVPAGGQQVALLGLNSAWLCASDEDEVKRLVLGERQVRAAIEQAGEARLKIAFMHHPFHLLREFDRVDAWSLLTQACDFVLHGHLHETDLLQIQSPDCRAMIVAAGAGYESRSDRNRYNWVRIHLPAGLGTVHLRRYSDAQGGFWVPDVGAFRNVTDGVYEFDP
jgi:hypothetical protein